MAEQTNFFKNASLSENSEKRVTSASSNDVESMHSLVPLHLTVKKKGRGALTIEERLFKIISEVEDLEKEELKLSEAIERASQSYAQNVLPHINIIIETGKNIHQAGLRAYHEEKSKGVLAKTLYCYLEQNIFLLQKQFGFQDDEIDQELEDLEILVFKLKSKSKSQKELNKKKNSDDDIIPDFDDDEEMFSEMVDLLGSFGLDVSQAKEKNKSLEERAAELDENLRTFLEDDESPVTSKAEQNKRKTWDSRQAAQNKEKEEAHRKRLEAVFRKLYLQLARTLHPDKEQDPTRREEKTVWMQKLSAANEKHNFLELLRLLRSNPYSTSEERILPEAADKQMLKDYRKLFEKQKELLKERLSELTNTFEYFFYENKIFDEISRKRFEQQLKKELKSMTRNLESELQHLKIPGNLERAMYQFGYLGQQKTPKARTRQRRY